MIELKRILLPTDFSYYAAHAARYACALSEQFGAELHLLHVLQEHVSSVPEFGMGVVVPTRREESAAEAERLLINVVPPECSAGRSVVRAVRHGAPFVEIIR